MPCSGSSVRHVLCANSAPSSLTACGHGHRVSSRPSCSASDSGRRHERPSARVVPHNQVPAFALGRRHPHLAADEQPGQIVPAVERAAADRQVGIEHALGHGAALQRRRAQRPELGPRRACAGEARDADDRPREILALRWPDGPAVAFGPAAPRGRVPGAGGLVDHQTDEGALVVEHADTRGEEGDTPVRIGRTVDRVDDGQQAGGPVAGQSRLLRPDGQARPVQDRQRGVVGRHIEAVLPRPRPRQAALVEVVERSTDGDDGVVQHFEQAGLVHPLTIEGGADGVPVCGCPAVGH